MSIEAGDENGVAKDGQEQALVTGYHVRPSRALMDGRVPPWMGLDGRVHKIDARLGAIGAGRSEVEYMCRGVEVVDGVTALSAAYMQEAIFEHVRSTEFPELAPRLGSTMSFPTLGRCQQFARETRAQYGRLYFYEVALEPPQPAGARSTVADMALFTLPEAYPNLRQFYDPATEQARRYWSSAAGPCRAPRS
jgi:hypothetical protein